MAKFNGILSNIKGSLGNLTFKQNGGQTIVSEKITQMADSKTESQQRQRMKWTNVIRMYQVLSPYMKQAFGGTRNGRNDYNKFVSTNLALEPIYLTKAEANAGSCLVAPYGITQGTIKPIEVKGKGNKSVTDIWLGDLAITSDTTVAEFSNAVVQHNKLYSYGDQLTYFLLTQEVNAVTNVPMAEVDACFIVLDKDNKAKLLSLVDERGFAVQQSYLAAQSTHDFGNHGMVWVHSRKQHGQTLVSTQFIICENDLLAQYQGEEAYQGAQQSYGGVNDAYLTPGGGKLTSTSTPSATAPSSKPSSGSSSDKGNDGSGSSTGSGSTGTTPTTPPSSGNTDGSDEA